MGPALICFGLLFAASITYGRSSSGLAAASQGRYVTFDLLILVGCYLCLSERWPTESDDSTIVTGDDGEAGPSVIPSAEVARGGRRQRIRLGLRLAAILLVVWMVWSGTENGIPGGSGVRDIMQRAALVSAHAKDAPNSLLKSTLLPSKYVSYDNVRGLAELAKKDRLSFFATSEAKRLQRMTLPKSPSPIPLVTEVLNPTSGTVLRGMVLFVATASGDYPLKAVDFRIMSSATGSAFILHGSQFVFGFERKWSSTAVPNGTYIVRSVVHDVAGHVSAGPAVSFVVNN